LPDDPILGLHVVWVFLAEVTCRWVRMREHAREFGTIKRYK
jgi:hypothetical protein